MVGNPFLLKRHMHIIVENRLPKVNDPTLVEVSYGYLVFSLSIILKEMSAVQEDAVRTLNFHVLRIVQTVP